FRETISSTRIELSEFPQRQRGISSSTEWQRSLTLADLQFAIADLIVSRKTNRKSKIGNVRRYTGVYDSSCSENRKLSLCDSSSGRRRGSLNQSWTRGHLS